MREKIEEILFGVDEINTGKQIERLLQLFEEEKEKRYNSGWVDGAAKRNDIVENKLNNKFLSDLTELEAFAKQNWSIYQETESNGVAVSVKDLLTKLQEIKGKYNEN